MDNERVELFPRYSQPDTEPLTYIKIPEEQSTNTLLRYHPKINCGSMETEKHGLE